MFSDSKRHYEVLDGLRGVGALMVVGFHIFEAFAGGSHLKQLMNHGYLAVDFFFMLSGFVIGYAYDDRWSRMTLGDFARRRLIRLHPMIIMGMIIGAIAFYFSAGPLFPKIDQVPVWQLLLVMLIGCTLLPVPRAWDIRGWQEMHPLDGPAWSLFFEYIANVLYALFLRRASKMVLSILTVLAGVALVHLAVTSRHGDVIGGWALSPHQLRIGFTRLLFPFLGGLLLSRVARPGRIPHAFLTASLLLVVVLSWPRVGGKEYLWLNGVYDSFVIIGVFPLIVYLGACGDRTEGIAGRACRFLGDLSYPLYITHYPLIYVFTAWVVEAKLTLSEAWPLCLLVLAASIVIAHVCLRLYDLPVRAWLAARGGARRAKAEGRKG
nr:acyltransferase [Opitutus sp. ER46]